MEEMLRKEFIEVQVEVNSWKEVVTYSLKILEKANCVTDQYEDAILKSFETYGPYMVIAPGTALLHAVPGDYIKQNALSVINLKKPVNFGHDLNDPVYLVITLAAKDATSHLKSLQKLTRILMDEHKLERLKKTKSKEEMEHILLQ